MTLQVMSAATLVAGVQQNFRGTYDDIVDQRANSQLAMAMDLEIPTSLRETPFGYFEAPPPMSFWEQGSPIPSGSMESVLFTTPVHDWGRKIAWHHNDRVDDQIQGLFQSATGSGRSAAKLPEEFFLDILTGTPRTIPSIPRAPDGENLFSTTAKGSPRFDVSGGNVRAGSGVSSISSVLSDYYAAIARWTNMGTGKGERLLADDMIAMGALIIHGSQNNQIFDEAFLQKRQGIELAGANGAATPSNVVQDASRNVQLWSTPRILDDSWYAILLGAPLKPIFLLTREPLKEWVVTEDSNNSDRSRDTGEESVSYKLRQGAGVALPYAIIQVSNP